MALLGAQELRQDFRALRQAVGPPAWKKAARAGARIIRDEARRQLGKSRRSQSHIIVRDGRTADRGGAVAQVTIRQAGFYLRFVHGGAKPHIITAGAARRIIDPKTRRIVGKEARTKRARLVIRTGGLEVFRWRVQHPGVRRPNPFLITAADIAAESATQAVGEVFNAALDKRL